jgi:hypothetical protein
MGLRTFLFGKPGQRPPQSVINKQKQERENRKNNLPAKEEPKEHGSARDFPLFGGREAAQAARTFKEFIEICDGIVLEEGTKKRAKKALKNYEKMKRKEHKTAQELYKETEAGSKERKKQTDLLSKQHGGGVIAKRQKTIDTTKKALRTHADKLEKKKPHKAEKFKEKSMRRIQDIEDRYTFNPNRKINT